MLTMGEQLWRRVSAPVQLQARNSIASGLAMSGNLARRSSENIISADPEEIVSALRNMTRPNFGPMRQALKQCTQEWMLGFLEHGGLEQLFDCLTALSSSGSRDGSPSPGPEGTDPKSTPFSSLRAAGDAGGMMTAVGLLQCVLCIKAVMNSRCGLDYLIDTGKEHVKSLATGTTVLHGAFLYPKLVENGSVIVYQGMMVPT